MEGTDGDAAAGSQPKRRPDRSAASAWSTSASSSSGPLAHEKLAPESVWREVVRVVLQQVYTRVAAPGLVQAALCQAPVGLGLALPPAPPPQRLICGLLSLTFGGLVSCSTRLFRSDTIEYRLDQLDRLGPIGSGSFGSVALVRCRLTGQGLALKAVPKRLLVERRMQLAVKSEKTVMLRANSPFLIRLAATFSGAEHVYFLMEAAMGGDLHTVYERHDLHGSAPHAGFYAACAVRAIEYLHSQWIIYRDLKKENMVLDARGYAKLCDFGLARFLWASTGRAYTICGTPDYKAPEIDEGEGYTGAVDWWALGVLVYALATGDMPFQGDSVGAVRERVGAGIEGPAQSLDELCGSLVCGLCRRDPNSRLPMLAGGAENVREHPWFLELGLDWALLARRRLPAPHVPTVLGPTDLSNFCAEDLAWPSEPACRDPCSSWDEDFEDPVGPACLE